MRLLLKLSFYSIFFQTKQNDEIIIFQRQIKEMNASALQISPNKNLTTVSNW